MTTRNLSALFRPRSIALVGASNEPGTVGAVVARNLTSGGFAGQIWPVNPKESRIGSTPCFKSVTDLPEAPDLAVLATPARTVPGLIAELGARGCRAAVVITAGLDAAQSAEMLAAARPHLMRIVGPNCLGFMSPARGVNASFVHLAPLPGDIALLTQSGAIATSMIDWASGRGVGFSHVVSLGDMSDVDFGDLLDYLAIDVETRAILLYAENVTQARKFMSAGRIAARAKPVVVVKAGRSAAGARAAASHTGALAGADAVYAAAFRRAGMLRVDTLRDLFDAAETLASGLRIAGDQLMIVTNGGGLGVMAVDALEQGGGRLAALSNAAAARLDAALPRAWSHANPVDILGDAHGDRYQAALAVVDQEECDAVLVMNCPTGVSDNREAAGAVLDARAIHRRRPWLACWMGEATASEARARFGEAGLPSYETPSEAVRAFLHLVEYGRNQEALLQTPAAAAETPSGARETVRAIVDAVLQDGRDTLTEPEAKRVLGAYGIPVVATETSATPEDAGLAASRFNGPVVLKILSRQITHKSDVGGVRLNLEGAAAVEAAAREMLDVVRRLAPDAAIDGFTVQPMVRRPRAQELILGAVVDKTFGPCLLFGQGGVATEIIADREIGFPPLNSVLARSMIARTRVAKLLAGYRDRPPADIDGVAAALVALSDLVIDTPEIVELDINPLLADEDGVIALDARIVVRRATAAAGVERLAIRPYPRELQRVVRDRGSEIDLRPVRPQDAASLEGLLRLASAEAVCPPFGEAPERTAARLSQIDYDREMTFVALNAQAEMLGAVWLRFDPEFEAAEHALFAIPSRLEQEGRILLEQALAYAKARDARRVWGDIGPAQTGMLALAQTLGASIGAGGSGRVRCEFAL